MGFIIACHIVNMSISIVASYSAVIKDKANKIKKYTDVFY